MPEQWILQMDVDALPGATHPSVTVFAHCQSMSKGTARALVALASAWAAACIARMMFAMQLRSACHCYSTRPLLILRITFLVLLSCSRSAGGRTQPFYHVKVDERDQLGTTTYVAQENIEILRLKDVTHGDLLIVHDDEVCAGLCTGHTASKGRAIVIGWSAVQDVIERRCTLPAYSLLRQTAEARPQRSFQAPGLHDT